MRTAAALCALLFASPVAAACASSDFTLKARADQVTRYGIRVVGEVISKCGEPASVELQATVRDKGGSVVGNSTFFPADTRNIPPGGSQPFDHPMLPTGKADTLDLVIVSIRRR